MTGPFFESPNNFLGKLFYVCRVCVQDQSFKNFENDTMKLSVIKRSKVVTGL